MSIPNTKIQPRWLQWPADLTQLVEIHIYPYPLHHLCRYKYVASKEKVACFPNTQLTYHITLIVFPCQSTTTTYRQFSSTGSTSFPPIDSHARGFLASTIPVFLTWKVSSFYVIWQVRSWASSHLWLSFNHHTSHLLDSRLQIRLYCSESSDFFQFDCNSVCFIIKCLLENSLLCLINIRGKKLKIAYRERLCVHFSHGAP